MNQREIKFRAWNGERMMPWGFIEDSFVEPSSGNDYNLFTTPHMQFTGIKDKNGKEIYEGDIIRSFNGRIWIVKHGYWEYQELRQVTEQYGWYLGGDGYFGENTVPMTPSEGTLNEVIGNIYENPELLKS